MQSGGRYIVIGGGIAGVSCAQELARLHGSAAEVVLLTESQTVVGAVSIFRVTEHLHELQVYERSTDNFQAHHPQITIVQCSVQDVNYGDHAVYVKDLDGKDIHFPYDKLCICIGAQPRLIIDHPKVIGLRDQHSVEELRQRLQSARTVAIVGNGGIALELVNELTFCNVDWIIKSDYIGSAFFDASASAFILPQLHLRAQTCDADHANEGTTERIVGARVCTTGEGGSDVTTGAALGPEWVAKTIMKEFLKEKQDTPPGYLKIHREQEVRAVSDDGGRAWRSVNSLGTATDAPAVDRAVGGAGDFPLYVLTTCGQVIGCDFLVSATGVEPRKTPFLRPEFAHQTSSHAGTCPQLDAEGYIVVDNELRTSISNVFAAGDCCHYPSEPFSAVGRVASHFFQMRLWSQAHWMGVYAAQCMSGRQEDFGIDTKFELFAHITRFFGYKVVMLGRYNAQGLGDRAEAVTKGIVVTSEGVQYGVPSDTDNSSAGGTTPTGARIGATAPSPLEIWLRVTPGREYIKLTVYRGKLVGALLIGDTDLEEVCENLILNALDVSSIGIGLLDPDVDIGDYFD